LEKATAKYFQLCQTLTRWASGEPNQNVNSYPKPL
jgi:hypothetical protein